MTTETIYIAPGYNQCRVYAIPYPMRKGQQPSDIDMKYLRLWREIALLNSRLELVYIEPAYRFLKDEIAGSMGGTYFEVDRTEVRYA